MIRNRVHDNRQTSKHLEYRTSKRAVCTEGRPVAQRLKHSLVAIERPVVHISSRDALWASMFCSGRICLMTKLRFKFYENVHVSTNFSWTYCFVLQVCLYLPPCHDIHESLALKMSHTHTHTRLNRILPESLRNMKGLVAQESHVADLACKYLHVPVH